MPPTPVLRTPGPARYATILALAWTATIAVLAVWDIRQGRRVTKELAFSEARAHFNKDQAFRLWATSHGRIYVPVTEQTRPSPYMSHLPEQVIETPSGQPLTLITRPASCGNSTNASATCTGYRGASPA